MKENQNAASAPLARICWPDALRVVSIFAVMLIHQAATGYTASAPGSGAWRICLIFNSITRFAVPAFVMISGAMYLNPAREITAAHMLKKAGKLLAVFLFWSVLYAPAETVKEGQRLLLLPLLCRVATGHYHMWYLHLTACLYLLTPLLRLPAVRGKPLRAVMAAAFLLGGAAELLQKEFASWFGYLGYYCLGHFLYSAKCSQKQLWMLFSLSALLLIPAALAGNAKMIFSEKMPHIILYSAAVFCAFKGAAQWLERSERIKAAVGTIAPCVFGMYLVHPVFNFLFRRAGLYALTGSPLIFVPLCSALVWAASLTVVAAMKKLPLLRHFV